MSLECTCIRSNKSGCDKAFLDVMATPPTTTCVPTRHFQKLATMLAALLLHEIITQRGCAYLQHSRLQYL